MALAVGDANRWDGWPMALAVGDANRWTIRVPHL